MGILECFSIAGVKSWIPSNDHEPPHFHVKKKDAWEIKVLIETTTEGKLDFIPKWIKHSNRGPSGKMIRGLHRLVLAHRGELLLEWERKAIHD